MRRARLLLLLLVALPIAAIAGDDLVWVLRGRPSQQMDVNVFTVMELKGQKEDYGDPDVQSRPCNQKLIATGAVPTCWWLTGHRQIVQRP